MSFQLMTDDRLIDDRPTGDETGGDGPDDGRGDPLGRRGYLRLAGTAFGILGTLGALGAGVGTRTARAATTSADVDATEVSGTLTVPPGDSLQIHVGTNRYGDYGDLENVLIDITAAGADAIIKTHGGNWTIRNVGLRGESNGALDSRPLIVAKTAGVARIENVYLGDGGDHGGHGPGRAGVHVSYKHSGRITIRNLYVANWTDNGIYASSPGKPGGGGGVVEVEHSYGENNNIANFRIGTPGSVVEDSVSVAEGTQKDLNLCRGVWCRHHDRMVVSNTDIDLSGPAAAPAVVASKGGSVTYEDSDYSTTNNQDFKGDVATANLGTSPSTAPPAGVPTSAEEAAGVSPDPSVPSGPGEFTISNRGFDRPADYRFVVDGAIARTNTLNPGDEISGTTASGRVSGGADTYRVSGPITDFRADGPVALFMSGTRVSPAAPNELAIRGPGDPTDYRFAVGDELRPTRSLNPGDEISGTAGSGRVIGGTDRYRFLGTLDRFEYDGSLRLAVNGREVDPARYSRPANHLRVRGTGERSTYEFDVSGDLAAGPKFDTDGTDGISGSTGRGRVADTGTDDFYFDGRVVRFDHDGSLRVFVNGDERNPDSIGFPHELSIAGEGTRVEYAVAVSGGIEKSTARGGSINAGDEVSGSTVRGVVGGGTDSYGFGGEITDFRVSDANHVAIYVDGERVAPGSLGEHVLSIDGDGTPVDYDLQVTGTLSKSDAMGASVNAGDEISGSRARGRVGGGTDSYRFSGDIDYLALDTRYVSVSVDGERIDPGRYPPPHEIRVSNRRFDRPATYDFAVSGALGPTDSVNVTDGDGISGTSASGRVNGGADTYLFSGDVTRFAHDGPVAVYVDGDRVQ